MSFRGDSTHGLVLSHDILQTSYSVGGALVDYLVHTAVYAYLGRLDEARSETEEFLEAVQNYSIKDWARTEPYIDPGKSQHYVDGIPKTGLPA